ncbi:hypothetical protein CAEBREN_02642 [Caenorhabditis brenneri]|uniref:Uncharacterized protein n=1 Tax=Caenorhabditis brenneri TaxID=135651 RepID=G0NQ99_CAEBE|nr:hypothetical protein CAEBREN_02642 [Caenorhabditis brenneri]
MSNFNVSCIKCGRKSEQLRCCFTCAVVSGVLRYDEVKKDYILNLENTELVLQQAREMVTCENCESAEHMDHDSVLISKLTSGMESLALEKSLRNSLSSIVGFNLPNDVWRSMTRAITESDVPHNGYALYKIIKENLIKEAPIFVADRKQTFRESLLIGSFNPTDNSWTSIGRMPGPKVNYGVAINKSSQVAIFGGMYNGEFLRSVEVYDGEANVRRTCNPMKHCRTRPFGCFHNHDLYVAGGFDQNYLNSVEILNVQSGASTEAPSLKIPRADAALVPWNGEIFVLGGFNGKTYEKMIEKLNEQSQEFESFASMEGGRAGFGACEFRGRIYIAGGWNTTSNTLRSVRSFDPKTKTWRDEPSMNKVRKYFILHSTSEAIYAIRGCANNWVLIKEVERFDPDRMEWTVIPI